MKNCKMSSHITSNGHSNNPENDANNNSPSSSQNNQPNSPSKSSRWQTSTALPSTDQNGRTIPRFIFDPDSSLVFYWTAAVALATLYNSWMVALRIAFPEIRQENGPFYLTYVDMLSDLIYLLDILMQLRTAYLQDGIPVFDPCKIRQYYVSQTYFVQDVISVLPSQMILSLLPDAVGCCKYFLCTAGAARLTRLLKFHILYKFYDLAESFTSNPHLIRVLRLFLNLAIIIHWIACLYYLLSEYEGLGSNAWVYTNATDQQRFSRKYIICLYWSAMTLTTIGNTNSPETDVEYIFTGVIFLTGVFVFATVMGNVGDVISSMNANRQEFQARMDHIQMYLTHKKVPASLQLKIKKWAEYTWSRTKATDESRLLNMLPERLRAEVAVHVHLDSLKKIKIFEQCETGFLCELVLKLRSQVFSPGDYVCRVGETGREMFIINHGKVEVIVPNPANNKDMVVAVLTEGNYFGEISLLRLDGVQNRRTADVRSIGYSELLCLSRRDLMAALVEYPEAKSILEAQAKRRMKTNLQAQRAFSVDTLLRSSQDYSSLDSGIAKEENRGHDVSEIKAMIEELKNANKVPGRTVWQLIARCEVLQARLCEKEKEVEDSKRRIQELEQLLVSVHCPNPSRIQEEMPADESDISSVKHLRPNNKVVKQFSQDEGRNVTRDTSDNSANETMNSERRIVPDVKITRPASEAGSLNTENDLESVQKYVFKDDNFIKTSKISNVSFEKAQNSKSCQRQSSLSSQDNEFSQKFHISHTQKQSPAFTNSDISEDRHCLETNGNQSEGSLRIFSQNVLSINPSLDYSFSSETMIDHSLMFSNTERISLTTNFSDELFLNDPVDLSVHTIPEEPEEDIEDITEEPSFSNQQRPTSESSMSKYGNPSSVAKYIGQDSVYNNNSVEQKLTRRQNAVNFSFDGLDQKGNNKPSNSLAVKNFYSTLDEMTLNAFESGDGINFLKMGSISSCFSDDSNSRRNSWNWESDGDNDEDSDSS